MAQENRIDQLFREKLHGNEVRPSAQAWRQVNAQIGKKNKWPVYMSMAASVSILVLIGYLLIGLKNQDQTGSVATIDHPRALKEAFRPIEIMMVAQRNEITPTGTAAASHIPAHLAELENTEDLVKFAPISIANIRAVPQELNVPLDLSAASLSLERTVPQEVRPAVKITYIAAAEPANDTTKTKGISKFWSVAQSFSPAEVLADIRDAKDNLLSRNAP